MDAAAERDAEAARLKAWFAAQPEILRAELSDGFYSSDKLFFYFAKGMSSPYADGTSKAPQGPQAHLFHCILESNGHRTVRYHRPDNDETLSVYVACNYRKLKKRLRQD